MSLLDFQLDLHRTNELLERIAKALEAAVGPALLPVGGKFRKRGPEAIRTYGNNERLWLKDNFTNLIREKGYAPADEQALLDEAMGEFDQTVEDQAQNGDGDPE